MQKVFRLCCHSMLLLLLLPVALEPHAMHPPCLALHQGGILINLSLSRPSPSFYYIESTAWKSDTFLSVVSVNQESASGQVNPVDIVDVAYYLSLVYAHTSW